MFLTIGYDFFKDENSLNVSPTNVSGMTETKIYNGIFDHLNQTSNIDFSYNTTIPTEWDFMTLLDCNFNNNIDAGNVENSFKDVSEIKIKRRKSGTFDWLDLKTITIEDPSQINIAFNDNIALNFTEYEYALVPVIGSIEGNYISDKITTDFNGVFICDVDTIYKFYSDVSYGGLTNVQKVGVFEPFGRQYPIFVSNALINYKEGTFTSKIMVSDLQNGIDIETRKSMVEKRDLLLSYFTNHKSKIIKDWNGNAWLVMVTGNPTVSFNSTLGMGIMDVSFDFKESGNATSISDLKSTGVTG